MSKTKCSASSAMDASRNVTLNNNRGASCPQEIRFWSLGFSVLIVVLITLLGKTYGDSLGAANLIMLYLLPVIFASARLGVLPSVIVALISVLCFDIFFVPPVLQLSVYDIRYLITFVVFIVVAFTTGTIADRLRFRIREAVQREAATNALYALAKDISAVTDLDSLVDRIVVQIAETINAEVIIYLKENEQSDMATFSQPGTDLMLGPGDTTAVEWAYSNTQPCGSGTNILPSATGFYLPVKTKEKTIGVLGIKPYQAPLSSEQITLLEALAGLAALAIGRMKLAVEAQEIKNLAESERLRAALFNSISHDMRTPLASILGAVTSLVDYGDVYSDDQKTALLTSIREGALRMNRVIGNLLNMARLESGYMKLQVDWCDMQDIVGVTLRENREILLDHSVLVEIPENTRLIKADHGLIEQVLTNLLHNAAKYSPTGSEISIHIREEPGQLNVSVSDQGLGIPPGDLDRIFDKFYRLHSAANVSGSGLGLSICRGIIEAHGGRIWAQNHTGGGATIHFALPTDANTPLEGAN